MDDGGEDVFDLTQLSDNEDVEDDAPVNDTSNAAVCRGVKPQRSDETQKLSRGKLHASNNSYGEDDSESDSSSSDAEIFSLSQRMAKWKNEQDTRKRRSPGSAIETDGTHCEGPAVPVKRRTLPLRPPKVEHSLTIALLSSEDEDEDGGLENNHASVSRLGATKGEGSFDGHGSSGAGKRIAKGLKPEHQQIITPSQREFDSAPVRVKAQPIKGPHRSPTSSSSASSWLDGARGVVIGSQARSLSRSSSSASSAASSSSRSTSSSASGAEARRARRLAKEAEKQKRAEERAAAKAIRAEKKAELKRNKLKLQEQSGRFRNKELLTCFSSSIDPDLLNLVKALVVSDDRSFQEPRVLTAAPCENAVWWKRVSALDGKPMDPPVRPFTALCIIPGAFALELLHKSPVGDGSRLVDHLLVCREALLLHAVAEEDASRARQEERWGYGGDDSDSDSHRVIFVIQSIDACIASYHAASYANTHRHAASPRHVTNKSFDEVCTAAYVSDDLEIHCTKDNQETAEYIVELLTQLTRMQYEVDDDLAAFSLSKKYSATTLDGVKSSWLQQLQVVPRCSLSRARRIVALYPSLADLMKAYENPALSESDRELLLANVVGARSDAVLSRRIFRVLNSLAPHELV